MSNNIFMDGVPISLLRTSFLRQQIAMVSQDPMLSTGTVLDNVATGLIGTPYERLLDGSNDDEVRRHCQDALEKAQAWEFVSRLPDGIDSVVSGARTGVLSGGQRQRIAVARALSVVPDPLLSFESGADENCSYRSDTASARHPS